MSQNDINTMPKPIRIILTVIGCFFLGAISLGVAQGIVLFIDRYSQPL